MGCDAVKKGFIDEYLILSETAGRIAGCSK